MKFVCETQVPPEQSQHCSFDDEFGSLLKDLSRQKEPSEHLSNKSAGSEMDSMDEWLMEVAPETDPSSPRPDDDLLIQDVEVSEKSKNDSLKSQKVSELWKPKYIFH